MKDRRKHVAQESTRKEGLSNLIFRDFILDRLAPGGTFLEDGTPASPFSIFQAEDDLASIKQHVDVFHKLMRRYKYLQRGFEDTLMNLLQYINKFTPEDTNKLAMATGLFCSSGLATLTVLNVLFKEHLVKEGKQSR